MEKQSSKTETYMTAQVLSLRLLRSRGLVIYSLISQKGATVIIAQEPK